MATRVFTSEERDLALVRSEIEILENEFEDRIWYLIYDVWRNLVVPYCDTNNFEFMVANGDWKFCDENGQNLNAKLPEWFRLTLHQCYQKRYAIGQAMHCYTPVGFRRKVW